MTSLLIIAVMIIVLLGATSYALLNASAALSSQIDRATTQVRLEEAARGILANIVVIPGASAPAYAVPAPDSASAPNIPSWIMANAVNAEGSAFLYCPFTNIHSGTKATAISVPSGSYNVNVAALYSGGRNFVTISDTRPANASSALAIIVAPGEKASSAGDCTAISADGTLSGNNVRVITEADVMARDSVNASTGNQLFVGTAATGDGSGRSANNRAAFDVAITYTNQYRPQYMRLDLAAGTYTTTSAVFSQHLTGRTKSSVRNSAIDFRGAGIATTSLVTASDFDLRFVSQVYMQDLNFGTTGTTRIRPQSERNGAMIVNNVGLQYIGAMSGSSFYALGTLNIATDISSDFVRLYAGSKFYSDSTFNFPTGANFYAGSFRSYGGDVIFGSNSTITINSTVTNICGSYMYGFSRLYIMNALTNSQTSGSPYLLCGFLPTQVYLSGATITGMRTFLVDTVGRMVLDRGSSFVSTASNTPTTYFRMGQGGEVYITNSTLGSVGDGTLRPSTSAVLLQLTGTQFGVGVWAMGGGTSGGWPVSNLTVQTSGSNCWEGSSDGLYLAGNTSIYNGSYSRPLGPVGLEPWLIANRSNWYCNR